MRARGVWEALPAGWREAAATGAARRPVRPNGLSRPMAPFVRRARDGQPVESYGVAADGRLKPPDLSQAQPASDGQWRPCCVVFCPCPKGRRPLVTIDPGVGPQAGSATRPPQQHSAGDGGEGPGSDSGADGTNSAPQTTSGGFPAWALVRGGPGSHGLGPWQHSPTAADSACNRAAHAAPARPWPLASPICGRCWHAAQTLAGGNWRQSGGVGPAGPRAEVAAHLRAAAGACAVARACQCQWSAAAAAPASGPGAGARHGECRGAAAGGGH